jgi:hypothetical protein
MADGTLATGTISIFDLHREIPNYSLEWWHQSVVPKNSKALKFSLTQNTS